MGVKVRERPKGSGVWWLFIDHHGRRKAKKVGAKKAAEEAARKIQAKMVLGEFGLKDKAAASTFGDYAKTWREVTLPATCKPSTQSDYEGLLDNHILPKFKSLPVTDIKRLAIKKFLMEKINEGYASSTVTHMKNAIGGILNLAVDDEMIQANPAHRLGKIFQAKSLRIEIDPLTREELALLLKAFQEKYPAHYPMALTLARTGMRLGEAASLQWGDIDFHGRFITVQRGFSRGKVETPKNGKARRVDMSQQLSDTLKALRHQRKVETLKNGWKEVPEWLFISETGGPIDTSNWRKRVFNKALEKAKLRKIRVHDLRHGYASMLIQAGESLAYIRDQLGHHSIKVTVDIYGHLAPEGNKNAVDRLDDNATTRNTAATT